MKSIREAAGGEGGEARGGLTCNSLLGWGGAPRGCGGAREATAVPSPVAAALLIGRAWLATDVPRTWEVGGRQEGRGGSGHLGERGTGVSSGNPGAQS